MPQACPPVSNGHLHNKHGALGRLSRCNIMTVPYKLTTHKFATDLFMKTNAVESIASLSVCFVDFNANSYFFVRSLLNQPMNIPARLQATSTCNVVSQRPRCDFSLTVQLRLFQSCRITPLLHLRLSTSVHALAMLPPVFR